MKKSCLSSILILISIPFILLAFLVVCFMVDRFVKEHRSYKELYSTESDRELTKIIEKTIFQIANSKQSESRNKTTSIINSINTTIELNDVDYVCYSSNIYNTEAPELLDSIGIRYKYSQLLEDKRHSRYGEGSNILLFIKADKSIVPVFSAGYFMILKSKLKFSTLKMDGGCAQVPNNKLKIKINSSLEEKALVELE